MYFCWCSESEIIVMMMMMMMMMIIIIIIIFTPRLTGYARRLV